MQADAYKPQTDNEALKTTNRSSENFFAENTDTQDIPSSTADEDNATPHRITKSTTTRSQRKKHKINDTKSRK